MLAVKRYLSRGFSYDENPPAAAYPLESFLFKSKLGYCQQFSGAMALLLRMEGSRRASPPDSPQAHFRTRATPGRCPTPMPMPWVEAWFPRYGWVPVRSHARFGAGARRVGV